MRKWIEGIGYYLSCMILFNITYGLSILSNGKIFIKYCGKYNIAGIITFVLVIVCALSGIGFTGKIISVDDSENNTVSSGKKFEVMSVKNQTGEKYFANFSVIVLTGIALPSNPNVYDLMIFLLIEITLGVVYIKNKMYYMNPILSLLDFNIYECTGRDLVTQKEYDGTYHFLTRELHISVGTVIKYKNINSHVIRINNNQKG